MSQLNQLNKDMLIRLAEYYKYLYEEDKETNINHNKTMRIYLTILTFTFGFIFIKLTNMEMISKIFTNNSTSIESNIVIFLVCLSIFLFVLSFIFTISVLKMRKVEMLCKPRGFLFQSISANDDEDILSDTIVNYLVATERNYEINQKKAKFLILSYWFYLFGLAAFLGSFILLYYLL